MLRDRAALVLLTALFFLSGCAVKTAEEFRKGVRIMPFMTLDRFEVERPFKEVTETLRKKAKECLDVRVRLVCTNCIGNSVRYNVFTPTFIANPDKTELHLQFKDGGAIEIGAPREGFYVLVLDATPVDKKRTRVEIYRSSPDEKFIHKAMRGWVTGDNVGCPDLTTR